MTFRIGQRVRIVGATSMRAMIGMEAIVVSSSFIDAVGDEVHKIDVIGAKPPAPFEGWIICAHHLSPIQPSGHQVTTWTEMADLWQPEHLRETVK